MKLIVGLGNPGVKYAGTRHNVGFMVVTRLKERWKFKKMGSMGHSTVSRGSWHGEEVALAMPQTSMNLSGPAVADLLNEWKLAPADSLVVCDDVSLPLGVIRLRGQGSDGGHNGLASILQAIGNDQLPRLRVGIQVDQMPSGDLVEFVLEQFTSSEKKILEGALESAVEACDVWIKEGLSVAMNRFNVKVKSI